MSCVVETPAGLRDGVIATTMSRAEIAERVMDRGELVILKGAFPDELVLSLIHI